MVEFEKFMTLNEATTSLWLTKRRRAGMQTVTQLGYGARKSNQLSAHFVVYRFKIASSHVRCFTFWAKLFFLPV